jgi:hypothetical protein
MLFREHLAWGGFKLTTLLVVCYIYTVKSF